MSQFIVTGHYIDPYTWEILSLKKIVNIKSAAAARKWARQQYFHARINDVKNLRSSQKETENE